MICGVANAPYPHAPSGRTRGRSHGYSPRSLYKDGLNKEGGGNINCIRSTRYHLPFALLAFARTLASPRRRLLFALLTLAPPRLRLDVACYSLCSLLLHLGFASTSLAVRFAHSCSHNSLCSYARFRPRSRWLHGLLSGVANALIRKFMWVYYIIVI